jgi:hypothetical protein
MLRRLKAIVKKVRTDGIISGIRWLITKIYRRILPHRQTIRFTDLSEISSDGFSIPDNIQIQRLHSRDQMNKEDLKILIESETELMGSAANNLINKRFDKGGILWLIKVDNHLAGYRWTIVKDPLSRTYVPHTEKDVHVIATELFKEYRGQNLFILFTKYMMITLKNEGFKRVFSEIYLWNKRAEHAISKIEYYRKIGIARRFNFFGRNIVIWYDMSNKMNRR